MAPKKTCTDEASSAGDAETVRQTIVETIEAPRLKDIGTESFVEFKRRREIYERQIAEKNTEHGVNVPLTSYRSTITEPVLEMMVMAKWVSATDVASITEEQLKSCIDERARIKVEDYDLAYIQNGIKDVKLNMKEETLEMPVWKLGLAYTTALKDIGCGEYITKMPQLAVDDIMKRITHEVLVLLRMIPGRSRGTLKATFK